MRQVPTLGWFLLGHSDLLIGGEHFTRNQILVLIVGIWKGLYWCPSSQQTRYKESWSKLRDGGYKLRLDAIPFQAAKASGEIISDVSFTPTFL